jgi:hypothetical protein
VADDDGVCVVRNAEAANKPRHDNFSGVAVWIGQPSR